MSYRLERPSDGVVFADRLKVAGSPLARMRGLLGRPELGPSEGLCLEPARQVHTLGMRYPIDAVFCSEQNEVLRVCRLAPNRISPIVRSARRVFELPAGAAALLSEGDVLAVLPGGA